jgi:hypothetical protein
VERTLSPLEADDNGGRPAGNSDNNHARGESAFLYESRTGAAYESEGGFDRKRRAAGRESSPPVGSSKRLRLDGEDSDEEEEEDVLTGSRRRRRGGGHLSPAAAAHPTFLPAVDIGSGGGLMPPPASTVPVYYSYFER